MRPLIDCENAVMLAIENHHHYLRSVVAAAAGGSGDEAASETLCAIELN